MALEGIELATHHRRALGRLVERLEPDDSVRALVLVGSLAHGYARPDSDLDVQLVVDHAEMERRMREGRLTWADAALCDWDGGYVDAKYVDTDLLERVAARGSEPARYAFHGARIVYSRVEGLEELLARVVRYPIEGRDDRVAGFTAQLLAWRWYHAEAVRKDSAYLLDLARAKVVLFACRVVLARNERLYPFHKWLLAETGDCADRPATLLEDLDEVLRGSDHQPVARLVAGVLGWYGIDEAAANATWASRYMRDTELAWLHGRAPIDDV